MVLEVAILNVLQGQETAFEADFKKAGNYICSMQGYVNHTLSKCIEQENRYLLLVNWENLKDHTIGFRQSPEYQEWKALLHKYYDPFPVVEHYETVVEENS